MNLIRIVSKQAELSKTGEVSISGMENEAIQQFGHAEKQSWEA